MKTPIETVFLELIQNRPMLAEIEPSIIEAYTLLARCFENRGRIYLCGNGGSAADAEHFAGELLKGFYSKRPTSLARDTVTDAKLLELQEGLPAIPLTGFLSLRTAVANDMAPELEYAQLVWALGNEGDVLVAISTSGNARNVELAAQAAKEKGMSILVLTGQSGGKIAPLGTVSIKAPAQRTHLVQELHLSIYHALCLALEARFFPSEA